MNGCVFEVDFEYPKELHEFHKDYSLAPDIIEVKREMLSEYQLRIADLYNIPIGNVKKHCLTCLVKKSIWFIKKTYKFIWD